MTEYVWFMLADVAALRSPDQALVEGSKALLQCFVPAATFEAALENLDSLLKAEAFERLGLSTARRFEGGVEPDEVGGDHIWNGLQEALTTGSAVRGLMIVAQQTSSWKDAKEDPHR